MKSARTEGDSLTRPRESEQNTITDSVDDWKRLPGDGFHPVSPGTWLGHPRPRNSLAVAQARVEPLTSPFQATYDASV